MTVVVDLILGAKSVSYIGWPKKKERRCRGQSEANVEGEGQQRQKAQMNRSDGGRSGSGLPERIGAGEPGVFCGHYRTRSLELGCS